MIAIASILIALAHLGLALNALIKRKPVPAALYLVLACTAATIFVVPAKEPVRQAAVAIAESSSA